MLAAIVAALACGATTSGGGATDITADWNDLSKTGAGSVTGNSQTITFSGGGTRYLQVTYSEINGTLMYSKNSGSYSALTTDDLISVVTTDTIKFRYLGYDVSESFDVTVSDFTLGGEIDTFNVGFSV